MIPSNPSPVTSLRLQLATLGPVTVWTLPTGFCFRAGSLECRGAGEFPEQAAPACVPPGGPSRSLLRQPPSTTFWLHWNGEFLLLSESVSLSVVWLFGTCFTGSGEPQSHRPVLAQICILCTWGMQCVQVRMCAHTNCTHTDVRTAEAVIHEAGLNSSRMFVNGFKAFLGGSGLVLGS